MAAANEATPNTNGANAPRELLKNSNPPAPSRWAGLSRKSSPETCHRNRHHNAMRNNHRHIKNE